MAGARRLARRGPRPFADVPRTRPHDGEPDVHRLGRLVCHTDGCDDHYDGNLHDCRRRIDQELPLVRKIQWVMWYGFLLSFFLMVVMFFVTPTSTFTARFDRATQVIVGPSGLTYAQLLSGYFTPTTEAAWLTTLLVAPVALTSLGWVGYAQEQAG